MSWRLSAWLIASLALHSGLVGITYQLLREELPDALFIDLTLVPPDEEPVAVARAEPRGAALPGPGPAARSVTAERAKPPDSAVPPRAAPAEARRRPRAAIPDPAPPERPPVPAAPVAPPPVASAPPPAATTSAPAITAPPPATVPPAANEPPVAAPAIPPGPPPVQSLQAEIPPPDSSGGSLARSVSPNTTPGARVEHSDAGGGGPDAPAGDGAAASGREGGALALAAPGTGRGAEREYAAYYRLLRGRVVESVKYPPTARREGLTGTVEMDLFVEPTGTISRVVVVASSSHRVLDDAAVAAVRRVGRVPFPESLQPRPLRIRLPVVFVLQ